jgi:hypothetical protein
MNKKIWLKNRAEKLIKLDIRTIDDIAESLAEIQRILESHRNHLEAKDRETISRHP